ncbi:leucine-rich repeat protein [Ruminococcus sp. HUN007]|uniref:leucine-rich repeat protein n=1 Tax=Ruminococcus sp. HUN007 TaxID=1514668 RepID=UPI0005D278FF|nr:leucine-rich repeat protein [Ruminococcus sp. HUN007]
MKRARKGFTLVEVIIVLVIIAIVAAIAVPNISGYLKRSKSNNCQHTMNDFVNDLEYKIVSKRYYDVTELNDELEGLVEAASDSFTPSVDVKNKDGIFLRLEEEITDAAGICPNGGKYTVKWAITPGSAEDPNTAKVKIEQCECDCMDDEHIQLSSSYEFTAALIDTSEYVKSGRTIEDIYRTEIEKLLDMYNNDGRQPALVDDVVSDINVNSEYKIVGMTVSSIKKEQNVEWILVDHHEDYDASDPENKPGTHKFIMYYPLEDRMEILELSETDYSNKDNWPSAEGNEGSYLYLEGLNYDDHAAHCVADVKDSDTEWIQRDGNWYVQRNDNIKGIGYTMSEADKKSGYQPLGSVRSPKTDTDVNNDNSGIIVIAPDTSVSKAKFKDELKIRVNYNDGSFAVFDHLEKSSAADENYTIKNGFVLIDPAQRETVKNMTWSGIFSDSDSETAINDKQNLENILNNENKLLSDFFSGKKNELLVVYQEYNKYYENGVLKYEPVTLIKTIKRDAGVSGAQEEIIDANGDGKPDYKIEPSTAKEGDIIVTKPVKQVIDNPDGDPITVINEEEVEIRKVPEADGTIKVIDDDTNDVVAILVPDKKEYSVITKEPSADDDNDPADDDTSDDDKTEYKNADDIFEDITVEKTTYYDVVDPDNRKPVKDPNGDPIKPYDKETVPGSDIPDNNGSNNDKITKEEKPDGTIEIKEDNTVIAKLVPNKADFNITYKQAENSDKFSVDDLVIERSQIYTLRDETGELVKTYSTDTILKPASSTDQKDGYYLGSDTNFTASKTADSVKAVNNGSTKFYNVYLTGVSDTYKYRQIAMISAGISNDQVKCSYNAGENDSEFDLKKVSAWIEYPVVILANSNSGDAYGNIKTESEGSVKIQFKRKTSDSEDGWYLTTNDSTKYLGATAENTLLKKVNSSASEAVVKLYIDGDGSSRDIKLFDVKTQLSSLTEIHDINEKKWYDFISEFFGGKIVTSFENSSHRMDLSVDAHYEIKISSNDDYTLINFSKELNHKANDPEKYILYNSLLDSGKSPSESQENTFINDNFSSRKTIAEGSMIYVYYTDKITKSVGFKFTAKQFPDFIYFGSNTSTQKSLDNNEMVYLVAYIGNDINMTIPSTVTGYWTYSSKRSDSRWSTNNTDSITYNDKKIYYVNDGKTYKVKSVGIEDVPSSAAILHSLDGNGFFSAAELKDLTIKGMLKFTDTNVKSSLKSINISEGVTILGKSVFRDLKPNTVSLPSSLETIDNLAFKGAELSGSGSDYEFTIPENVSKIGPDAFENFKLNGSLRINGYSNEFAHAHENGPAINHTIFDGASFKNLTFGPNVVHIMGNAFFKTTMSGKLDLGSVKTIGPGAFSGWSASTGDLEIPESVISIEGHAFQNYASDASADKRPAVKINGATAVKPNGNVIEANIFDGIRFRSLSFGPAVDVIEPKAFMDNPSAASLDLGNVKAIGGNAFSGWENAYADLIIPDSVQTIGPYAFDSYASAQDNHLKYPSLTVNGGSFTADNTTKLGSLIFTNSHFRNVSIGGNVDEIDTKAFDNSPLNGKNPYTEFRGDLIISDKVSRVGENAFKNCAGFDGKLTFPDGGYFRTIDNSAFSGCFRFTGSLTIPDGTEVIGTQAFNECRGFNGNLSLPNALPERGGLTDIGDEAFRLCSGLKGDLNVPATVQRIGNSTFEGCTGFNGSIDLGSSIQQIGIKAFKNCTGFKGSLVVPDTVTSMGERAFDSYAAALTDSSKYPSLTVNAGDSNNGLNLGGLIFTNSHFKNVYVGGKIVNIGAYAFSNEPIKETPESDAAIPYSNFIGKLNIGNNVSQIGNEAFKKCSGFTDTLDFSENQVLSLIGNEAFEGCTGFTGGLNIPDSVQTIGIKSFEGCTGFDGSIKLSSDLGKIGAEAFRNCIRIKGGLTIPETVTGGIGPYAFENFASAVSDTDAGKLTIGSGSTGAGKTLGAFIFNGSKFNGMSVGGLVETVSVNAFKHDMTPLPASDTDSDGEDSATARNVVADYSKIRGTLSVGSSVKVIDNSAFQEMNIEGLTGMAGVQRIGRYAFWKCDKIASDVTFEGNTSLERIEREAFYGTSSLGSLTIPPTVTFMGPYAFDNSGSGNGRLVIFGASRIENGKKYLGDNKYSGQPDSGGTLFNHARYRDVVIGGNVDVIGQYFMKSDFSRTDGSYDTNFDHHGITGSLTITGNVSEIEGEAFNDAGFDGTLTLNSSKLETIGYSAFENLPNMYGDITIPQTVHNIDRRAFKKFAMNAPDSKLGTLRIKGYSESNGNQHIIGYRLFSFARFKSVEIGGENSSVNTIGNFAFYNSSFETDSTFEDNQTKYEAFDSGSGYSEDDIKVYRHLKYDETKEGVKVNNDNSNYSSFTQELKILDGIETIGTRAFGDNHSILEVKLESSTLKTIGKDAFNRCTKAGGGLTIPKTVTSIGRCAFKQYGENTDNPGTLTVLGYSDSSSDGKTRYIGIPLNDINGDPKPIFPSAKFKNVVIGGTEEEASVNAIGDKFMNNMDPKNNTYNYSGMTGSLTIGKSIKSVGREAFVKCTGFNGALTLNENLQTIGADAFNACNNFHGDLTIPSTVTSIGPYAFKHFGQGMITSGDNTGSLTILGYSSVNDNYKTIDKDIFNHAHFNNVTIGGNVECIADGFMNNNPTDNFGYGDVHRFEYVTGNLTIGDGVKKIGTDAFWNCYNFDGVLKLGSTVEHIGQSAFSGCGGLYSGNNIEKDDRKIVIPSTVTYIGNFAFKGVARDLGDQISDSFPSLEIYGSSHSENNKLTLGGSNNRGIFSNARFKNVTIGGNVKVISNDFMNNWKWSNIYTTDENAQDVSRDELFSFIGGNLTIQDNTVEEIGENAFGHIQFDDVYIGRGIKKIGRAAFKFAGTGNGKLTLYSGTVDNHTLGEAERKYPAFIATHFNGLKIGGDVTTIADYFMKNAENGDKSQHHAFKDKDGFTLGTDYTGITGDVEIEGTVKTIGKESFSYMESDDSKYRGKLILNEGIESIGESAFANTRFFGGVTGERALTIPASVTFIGTNAFQNFCSNFGTKPSLTILGGNKQSDGGIILVSNLFGGAGFNNVTIGGNVTNISGLAFYDAEDENKYSGITGILTILPKTVGYNGTNYIPLQPKNDKGTVIGGGMSFRKHEDGGRFAPFLGVKFSGAVFPKGLYDIFVNNQWDLFDTWDGRGDGRNFKFTAVG